MIQKSELLKSLPDSGFKQVYTQLEAAVKTSDRTIFVLDDDPTGCQTLYDIPVLFNWDAAVLQNEMLNHTPLLFLMTNSRSLPEEHAVAMYSEIGQMIRQASEKTGRAYSIISRSDSTLRGHYPAEPKALEFLYDDTPVHIIIPAFFQGGRYTIEDEHYVQTGDMLVKASETPFAKDKVFGFTTSNLKEWVEEKTGSRISREDVYSFGLKELRLQGPEYVAGKLCEMEPGAVAVVNAAEQNDLDIFSMGALMAEQRGAKLLYRTAASFLNSFGAKSPKPPLDNKIIGGEKGKGGLFIVGSYVPKSTEQLEHLRKQEGIWQIELEVPRLLDETSGKYLDSIVSKLDKYLAEGQNVLLYTSRKLVFTDDSNENLEIGRKVSDALVSISGRISNPPAFIVAKGGITSHDIASRGLKIRRAMVAGAVLPGIPLLVPDDRPDLKYIVFPGNVGDNESLTVLLNKLVYSG